MADLIGRNLGPYRIVGQLGLGGMATVYKAYHPTMDRYVALKVPQESFAREASFRVRFLQDARMLARLEHPHVLPVYDFGEDDGIPFFVMRCVEGGSLREWIASGTLSVERAVVLIGQVGEALDYAHRRGVIHRDVKPGNVLVDDVSGALLTDFGIAKILEDALHLTGTGVGLGTPYYMSPEQVQGMAVDARADIYSLGVVLYEAVTRRRPYEADTPLAVALMHVNAPLPLPRAVNPSLPDALERVILRALAKNPNDRFETAGAFASALMATIQTTAAPRPSDETQSFTPGAAERPVADAKTPVDQPVQPPVLEPLPRLPENTAARDPEPVAVVTPPPEPPIEAAAVPRAPDIFPGPRRYPVAVWAGSAAVVLVVLLAILFLRSNPGASEPASLPGSTDRSVQSTITARSTEAPNAAPVLSPTPTEPPLMSGQTSPLGPTATSAPPPTSTPRTNDLTPQPPTATVALAVDAPSTLTSTPVVTPSELPSPTIESTFTTIPTITLTSSNADSTATPEAPSPTEARPTATTIATSTPPPPSPTSVPPTLTLAGAPAPILGGSNLAGGSVTLTWSYPGQLGPNDYFDVRVWKDGQPAYGIANVTQTSYVIGGNYPPGTYNWTIALIRKQGGAIQTLSQASQTLRFTWTPPGGGGCRTPPYC